jgi:type VI secretion system secreted protein Hcp
MAFDILLKLDRIEGESTTKGHDKEIEVLSYDQSIDMALYREGSGGGAGAGKSTFSAVRIRKLLDNASIPIALACASGLHIASARIAFRRPSPPLDFYVVTLEDVLVTHVGQCASTEVQAPLKFETLGKSPTGPAALLEEVTLNFGTIRWEYRRIGPKGNAVSPITGGWDVNGNRKL